MPVDAYTNPFSNENRAVFAPFSKRFASVRIVFGRPHYNAVSVSFSSPEPTILLAWGRNRELWEQPFQACATDADCVKPDGQNSVIYFVISKWLLPELSIRAAGQKDHRLWGRECIRFENSFIPTVRMLK